MATNFSPCKGSYVLNQFPSNVVFGMNGFHISASGAIQGHMMALLFYLPPPLPHFRAASLGVLPGLEAVGLNPTGEKSKEFSAERLNLIGRPDRRMG